MFPQKKTYLHPEPLFPLEPTCAEYSFRTILINLKIQHYVAHKILINLIDKGYLKFNSLVDLRVLESVELPKQYQNLIIVAHRCLFGEYLLEDSYGFD